MAWLRLCATIINRFKIVLLLLSGAMLFNFVDYWPIRDVGYFTGFPYGNKDQTYCNETGCHCLQAALKPWFVGWITGIIVQVEAPNLSTLAI
jgi:hypothetical protein